MFHFLYKDILFAGATNAACSRALEMELKFKPTDSQDPFIMIFTKWGTKRIQEICKASSDFGHKVSQRHRIFGTSAEIA